MSIIEEQVKALDYDELVLVINKIKWFHDNRKNRRHGGQKEDYNYGDPNHFIANCPR